MKKYWNRLLAGGMALAMALTLLPVQTLAQELWDSPEAEPQVDAATRSITLPVLTQDGEIPLSEEEEETGPITYVYETQDSFSLETGRQGKVLNEMIDFFRTEGFVEAFKKNDKMYEFWEASLKEFVGHTPMQVAAGCILGIVVGCIMVL